MQILQLNFYDYLLDEHKSGNSSLKSHQRLNNGYLQLMYQKTIEGMCLTMNMQTMTTQY